MTGEPLITFRIEDDSNLVFTNRISTLKIRVKNESDRALRGVFLSPPPAFREKKEVKARYGNVQHIWGGGFAEGSLVSLPGDRTTLRPGEEGIAYFLVLPWSTRTEEVPVLLDVYADSRRVSRVEVRLKVVRGDLRAYLYRPRYIPRIDESSLPLVRRIIEEYGVPDIEIQVWPISLSTRSPRVEVLFEGREVATITGDVGSGFMHVSKIKVHRNVFVGEARSPEGERRWYWVARIWLFWLDRSIFDEVPDAERVELWINPDTEKVDWLVTDEHWKEVAYKGPVSSADVKIQGGVHRSLRSKLIGLAKSYHPPKARGMELYKVSPDSRNPGERALTLENT